MSVILHLGFHKTGTTAFQHVGSAVRNELLEQGWAFQARRDGPLSEAMARVHEHRIGNSDATRAAAVETMRREVEQQLSAGRQVLISDEMLLGMPLLNERRGPYPHVDRSLDVLRSALEGIEVAVWLTVRRQPEYLESVYVQTVQSGHDVTFPAFYASLDLSTHGWSSIVTKVIEAFAATTVVPYEHLIASDAGLVNSFFDRMGVEVTTEGMPLLQNVSFPEEALLAALGAYPALDMGGRRAFRRFLQRRYSDLSRPRPRLLTEAGRQLVLAAVADDNASLFATHITTTGHTCRDVYTLLRTEMDETLSPDDAIDPMWAELHPLQQQWSCAVRERAAGII